MIRAVIVDDLELARARVRRLLGAHNDITVTGEAADAAEATTLVLALRPTLLMLDIRSGPLSKRCSLAIAVSCSAFSCSCTFQMLVISESASRSMTAPVGAKTPTT